MNRIAFAVMVLVVGCTPHPPSPVTSDADAKPGKPEQACLHLKEYECPEGSHPKCVEVFAQVDSAAPGPHVDLDCIIGSTNVTDLRDRCGVRCQSKK